jgi:hypothetical protein
MSLQLFNSGCGSTLLAARIPFCTHWLLAAQRFALAWMPCKTVHYEVMLRISCSASLPRRLCCGILLDLTNLNVALF